VNPTNKLAKKAKGVAQLRDALKMQDRTGNVGRIERRLADLPEEMPVGVREVALVTVYAREQAFAFKPVMRALKTLSKLKSWSKEFLVADGEVTRWFSWKDAPLRRYKSFKDFYAKELEKTWGSWERLQQIYRELVAGKLTHDEASRAVYGTHGGDRRSAGFQDSNAILKIGRGRAYTLARLDRDRRDLAVKVRAGQMTANAAAIKAGFRKPTFTVRADVDGVVRMIKRRFSLDERLKIAKQLVEGD
jgi:polyhydroxyalkanoate synthesis regulator phasin